MVSTRALSLRGLVIITVSSNLFWVMYLSLRHNESTEPIETYLKDLYLLKQKFEQKLEAVEQNKDQGMRDREESRSQLGPIIRGEGQVIPQQTAVGGQAQVSSQLAPVERKQETTSFFETQRSDGTKQHFILTVNITDRRRFGNLLFNYASLWAIARVNNMEPVCDPSWLVHEVFQTKMRKEKNLAQFGEFIYYKAVPGVYDNRTRHLPRANVMMDGYFQSWKYFEGFDKELREHFIFHKNVTESAARHMQQIIPAAYIKPSVTKVAIHVRRGGLSKMGRFEQFMPGPGYFSRAMKHFREKFFPVIFVVCSDDINWCKLNIRGPDVVFSESNSWEVDFAILTSCDHTIMSTGTFGWWVGWFNNGTTIYYNWFHSPVIKEKLVFYRPYFKQNWIPMY